MIAPCVKLTHRLRVEDITVFFKLSHSMHTISSDMKDRAEREIAREPRQAEHVNSTLPTVTN